MMLDDAGSNGLSRKASHQCAFESRKKCVDLVAPECIGSRAACFSPLNRSRAERLSQVSNF